MAGVTNPVHPSLDQILDIRAMRIVACVAFLLGKRSMRELNFLSFFRLGMAAEA
jgi:hypothetical protein